MTARRKAVRRRARRAPDTLQRRLGAPYPHSEMTEKTLRAAMAVKPHLDSLTAREDELFSGILSWCEQRPASAAQLDTMLDIARRRAGYTPRHGDAA